MLPLSTALPTHLTSSFHPESLGHDSVVDASSLVLLSGLHCRRPARTRAQAIATGMFSAQVGHPPAAASEQARIPSASPRRWMSRGRLRGLWPSRSRLSGADVGPAANQTARLSLERSPVHRPSLRRWASSRTPADVQSHRTPVHDGASLRTRPLSFFVRMRRVARVRRIASLRLPAAPKTSPALGPKSAFRAGIRHNDDVAGSYPAANHGEPQTLRLADAPLSDHWHNKDSHFGLVCSRAATEPRTAVSSDRGARERPIIRTLAFLVDLSLATWPLISAFSRMPNRYLHKWLACPSSAVLRSGMAWGQRKDFSLRSCSKTSITVL